MKVLIVDDNANDRRLLRYNLERHGFETVIEGRNGWEGLELARSHRPDLIISDAMMPRMDGFEFLRTVKTDDELKLTPFVFHSSVYTGSKDEELASSLGAEAFITKPKEPDEFWNELSAVLVRLANGNLKPPPAGPMTEEQEYLRQYSGAVAAKLEEKVRELEESLTRRKEAEEALVESEERYRGIFENAVEGIFQSTPEGRFLTVNPAVAQMLGYATPEETVAAFIDIQQQLYVVPEDRANFRRLMEENGEVRAFRTRFRRRDGSVIWVSLNARAIRGADGRPERFEGTMEDISEVRQREDQLRQAQKMEAIGQLAGGIAHDFNNILTVITGFGTLALMNMKEGDPLRANIEHILAASDRAANLNRSLLTFSRQQIVEPRPAELNDIIRSTGKLLRRLIGEDIQLTASIPERPLVACVDIGQIEQVLMNLATNARDAMPGGGTLHIGIESVHLDEGFVTALDIGRPGMYALVSLTDTGHSMDETTQQKIFEPFFTTKEIGKGTGLGLAIAYGIIKQHGGHITVRSEAGKGTSFRIFLPLVEAERLTDETLLP